MSSPVASNSNSEANGDDSVEGSSNTKTSANAAISSANHNRLSSSCPVETPPSKEASVEILRLTDELNELRAQLKAVALSSNDSPEIQKKQYEAKLKDVMEKARDHAKKLAQERDELRKQVELRDSKLSEYKQVANMASTELQAKDSTISDQEKRILEYKNLSEKLQQQIIAVETHYTTPPSGDVNASLSVVDPNGVEWLLVGDRWWRKHLLSGISTVGSTLSTEALRSLENEVARLARLIEIQEKEFHGYKSKAEKILQDRMIGAPTDKLPDPENGIQLSRKIIQLEEEKYNLSSQIESQRKQILTLQQSEKNLVAQIAAVKAEVTKLVEPVDRMEAQIIELKNDKRILGEKLASSRASVADLTKQLEETRLSFAASRNVGYTEDTAPVTASEQTEKYHPRRSESAFTQTDFLPGILFRADQTPTGTPLPETERSRSASLVLRNSDLVSEQHDAVAIPLRQQIRELIFDLENEKHEHRMTITQLQVIKEEMRKLEAERKLGADLTDPVKVEYMRNVARKFISIAPVNSSDEYEQLIPVILNFFGLEGDEAVSLMKERRKRVQESSSTSTISFPKLW